jgi:hypothetical protein
MDPLIIIGGRRATRDDDAPDTVPDGLAEPAPILDPMVDSVPDAIPDPVSDPIHESIHEAMREPLHEPIHEPIHGPAHDSIAGPVDFAAVDRPAQAFEPVAPADVVPSTDPVALVEVLDRDGQVRQAITVAAWPLRIGRALDNHVVLSDPHVAPAHVSIERGEHALEFALGNTRNGVQLGNKRLRAGDASLFPVGDEPFELTLGRTRLRLRLADQPLAAELPLASAAPLLQRLRPIVIAALVVVLGLLFNTYLDTDPDGLGRAVGSTLLAAIVGTAIWCSAWALLSKTFTRQAHFGWHLRVFLFASIALLVVGTLPALLAFSLSWPWLSDFAFVGIYVVGAAALYFHLLAVEPAKHRILRWVAATGAIVGIGLTLWFNQQRGDQLGDELYMNHLFPPVVRLARPVPADRFVDGLTSLKATLDKKAKDTSGAEEAGARGDDV